MASTRSMLKVVSVEDSNGPVLAVDLAADKRNRICNWTDGEIIRLLEILQEERSLKDLLAQRNKQVFSYVASKMREEGADKTWDQCRVKLKNLKSQYRFLKDRMPHVASVDLESDDVIRALSAEAASRGITAATLKHVKYLKRFLIKMNSYKSKAPKSILVNRMLQRDSLDSQIDESLDQGVSPPTSPRPGSSVKIVAEDILDEGPSTKRPRLDSSQLLEKFNEDMMGLLVEQQRGMQAEFARWESEREREHALAMERFRQEARQQQQRTVGVFVNLLKRCNEAMADALGRDDADAAGTPVCNGNGETSAAPQ